MNPSSRRLIIGDVHGHYDGLMSLLDAIAPSAGDQLYFLGDLVDRGPRSADVVEFVKSNGHHCLLGNHEQLLLDSFPEGRVYTPALHAWLYSGGRATLNSYPDSQLLIEHLEWIAELPTYLDLGDLWLVHAGLNPQLPLAAQTSHEYCWIRDEFHSAPRPYFANKLIVTGHTITFTLPNVPVGAIAQGPGWIGIDTGAYHPKSGWLTAIDPDAQKVYQYNVMQELYRTMPLPEATATIDASQLSQHRLRLQQQLRQAVLE
jgi:serine/threonine protein phosphatase 1